MLTRVTSLLVSVLALALTQSAAQALPFDSTAVEIVEFTDYQCPFCSRAESTIAQLKRDYGAALRVTVRHQPLPFHQHAMGAALAAEAAREQGRFDEMHDRLFANQQALDPNNLIEHARALGLDVERFKRDMAAQGIKDRVQRDMDIANAVGATGTPAFFINGLNLRGAQPIEQFKQLIDAEIAEASRANRRGDAWLSDRLSSNNSQLWGFLRGGQVPPAKQPTTTPVAEKTIYKVTVDPKVDAIDGPKDALITMVVFAEYQCPFCKKLEPTLEALMTRYQGKIRRVFKHMPLPFHKDAEPAAKAAICAQQQGKFWEMHRSLFEDQARLDEPSLRNRASVLGLNLAKFDKCLVAPATEARMKADMALAGEVTARGTPNTFINGRKITGAKPIEDFASIIDEELKRAQQKLADGVKPTALYDELIKDGKTFRPLEEKVNKFAPGAPMLGNKNAKVIVTVFSDLQCPFCSRLPPVLSELVDAYKGKVAVQWKHFPLSFHKEAMPAAKAAMCAHEQDKFWPATDHLFANQKSMLEAIQSLPATIGIDPITFVSCLNRDDKEPGIQADMAEAREAEVRGTPTVFIQGRKFNSNSGYNLEAFKAVIDPLLAGKEP